MQSVMKQKAKNLGLVVLMLASSFAGLAVLGQAPAQRAAPRGRLPAYYKDLVSPEQREEIYGIQAKYNGRIAELKAEVEKLEKERDAAVEKVLTPTQQARLKLLRESKGKSAGEAAPKKEEAVAEAKDDEKTDAFPK